MNQQRNNYKSGTKKCVNPVFEEWLVELRDDAIARDLQSKHTYTKCLQSLRKYPLPLKTGKECVILEGFGDKICKLIDEKLTSFIQDGGVLHQQEDEITYERTVSVSYRATTSKSSSNIVQNRYNANDDDDEDRLEILDDTTSKPQSSNILKEASNKPLLKKSKTIPQRSAEGEIESVAAETSTKSKKRANPKEYKPGVRSGGYAILVALYNHENENDGDESSASYMLKADLIREAQKHCDSSFTFSLDPNNRYTAWSSMSKLVKKEYVVKENKLPARYHLTESGRRLAAKLLNGEDETETITQNQTDSDSEQVIDSPPKTLKYDWRTTNEKSNPVESCSSNSRLLQAEKSNKIIDEDIVQLSESDSEVVTLSDDLQVDEVYTQKASTKLSPLKKPQQKKEIIVGNDTDEELPDIGTFTSQMSARSSKTDVFVDDDFSDPKFIAQQMEIEKQIKRTPTNLMKSKSSSMMSSSSGNSSKPMTQTMDTIPDKRVVEKPPIISSKQQSASSAMSSKTAALSADYSNGAPSTMFKMNPGTFEIILYVDNCEQSHAKRQDMLMDELKKSNIRFESGKLHIGDFVWIARSKNANGLGTDLVLNYAVERKRMDDFCSSIIDGRYKEQKFRLNKCGITNPIYLIEEFGSTKHMSLPEKSLIQADVNTQLIDHFVVHHTTDVKDSAAYLIALTKYIDRVHRNLTLHGCLKTDLDGYLKRVGPSLSKTKTPLVYLMTFEEFNEFSNKNKPLSIREMFAKWLMKIQGVSQEKCIPIIELYPTPTLLISAYSKCENESKREKLLATVKFGSQQRNIGPVISKLISQLFYSNKPLS